jgi:hypothetical protein
MDTGGDATSSAASPSRSNPEAWAGRRSFTVSIARAVDMAGMQIIGWDEAKKQIRSWAFDSDGGFNQGVREKAGERWSVQKTATLPDGTLASSTSLLTPLDENSFTWQQVSRVVGANHPLQLFQLFVVGWRCNDLTF